MNIEVLKKNGKKKIILLITLILSTFITILCGISLAKYRSSKSISIARGTVNYKQADLNLVSVYLEDSDNTYKLVSDGKIPTSGYTLNEDITKTRCEIKGGTDTNIKITYENGEVSFSKLTTAGTKCYLYFDKVKGISTDEVIAGGMPTDDSMFAGISGNGIYTWTKGDYSGGDQPIKYFRGSVDNNWVVFGKDGDNYIWWRIIRSNSNGSLRMIYAGTSSSKTSAPATTGAGTQIGTSAYNSNQNNNMYVGFKYTSGQVHGNGTASTILGQLETWYNKTLAKNSDYSSNLDVNAAFCNDRTTDNGTGIETSETNYMAQKRIETNKSPSLLCENENDILKLTVGLITADEVLMSGMVYSSPSNTKSYLHSNNRYWTMTPYNYGGSWNCANVFIVHSSGYLVSWAVDNAFSIRPVINLKSDTLIEQGTGISTNPYVVQGT